jgi:hypothetical protein
MASMTLSPNPANERTFNPTPGVTRIVLADAAEDGITPTSNITTSATATIHRFMCSPFPEKIRHAISTLKTAAISSRAAFTP